MSGIHTVVNVVMVAAACGGLACAIIDPVSRRPRFLVATFILTAAMIDGNLGSRALISPVLWAGLLIVFAPVSLLVAGRGSATTPMSVHRALVALLIADLLLLTNFGGGMSTTSTGSVMQHPSVIAVSLPVALAAGGVVACVFYCARQWAFARGLKKRSTTRTIEVTLMTVCVLAMAAMAG